MRLKASILLFLLVGTIGASAADKLDKYLDWPVMGVPIVNHSPETNFVFGAAAQGYFVCPGQQRTSIVQLDGAYSLAHQWYLNTSGTLYVGQGTSWILNYHLGYRDYPDTYFGRGNQFLVKSGYSYRSRRLRVGIQPMCVLPMHWSVGPDVRYLFERLDSVPTISSLGLGLVVQYDSRDVTFYPHRGLFFKFSTLHHEMLNRNYRRLGTISIDLRHYVPLYKDLIFAWQFRNDWALGHDVPFPLLPSVGGQDLVRGVRYGMYRENALLAIQTELRIPIYRILHGTVFAGVGDVYSTDHWTWAVPKVGYGLGLRVMINRAKVNIRMDIARNNIYKEWNTWESYSFYLTATEAF